jgi:P-type Mg2+ transporter
MRKTGKCSSRAIGGDEVIEGRRTMENATKYILMGSSSNFDNMFSMAGVADVVDPSAPQQSSLRHLGSWRAVR